ncbi:MAG TPA: hypothetical protein VNW51_00060 [Mucilaginibacter sp.]|jgi:hypothetical protein|nr:hypothetical protein [Mucilaginibacter sp.]
MRFSQRIGKSPVRTTLQIESIDGELSTKLWNTFAECMLNLKYYNHADNFQSAVAKIIWVEFLNLPLTSIPRSTYKVIDAPIILEEVRRWYVNAKWYEVYDFIEFIASEIHLDAFSEIDQRLNQVLSREVSGYRIIEQRVVQITSEEEIATIEEALEASDTLKSVNSHLQKALDMLANRQSPDYRNSIKESISAVEAFCKIITGDSKATLGKTLAILETKHNLHSSLKESYSKLYGYTSDAQGIRHALLEDGKPIEFEDAKFMLVSCSAFINYLKAKLNL